MKHAFLFLGLFSTVGGALAGCDDQTVRAIRVPASAPVDLGVVPIVDAGPPPDSAPVAECGQPLFPDGTTLRRRPYLQSITTTSARVAWTTTSNSIGSVRLWPRPGGP